MFKQIIDRKNLEKAYLLLASDMENDGRAGRYRGWDGLRLDNLENHSHKTIKTAQEELINFQPLAPAVLFKIPKKSNPLKDREIYIYNLKERIKAQAIYQILEPSFDQYFSPYLFSYRKSHPSYFAARSAVRHYLKYYQRDFVLVADLTDYSNYTKLDKLKEKIKRIGFTDQINKLLFLFIGNTIVKAGRVNKTTVGLIQGTPLIALFNNLYLDDFDKFVGPKVDFYRRVGDDLIAFDQKKERLDKIMEYLEAEADDLGLKINRNKTKLIKSSDSEFNFLGYRFRKGLVGLEQSFCRNLVKRWKAQFSFYASRSQSRKKLFLNRSLTKENNNLKESFQQFADQKKLATDEKQIKKLSETFFRVLTRYFFQIYSERNRRLLEKKLKKLGLLSLYHYFTITRYGIGKGTN